MKVLILTGKFGMGHVSAAAAVKEELEQEPGTEAEIVDIVDFLFPATSEYIYKGFNLLSDKLYGLYNLMNRLDERRSSGRAGLPMSAKIDGLLRAADPDVVISTLPIASKYVGAAIKKSERRIRYITCITDIMPHNEWISEAVSAYMVGDTMTEEMLKEKGVAGERIFVSGIPVRKQFRDGSDRGESEDRLGADGRRKKEVLIMGGGLGLIPDVDELLRALGDAQITVITGKNEKLRRMLEKKGGAIEAVGYTDRVSDYMRRADLLVTKAGGATVFEAIWSETPMFILPPFLEQEKSNAEFAERRGVGVTAEKQGKSMAEQMDALLKDEVKRQRMKENMRRMKRQYERQSIRRCALM